MINLYNSGIQGYTLKGKTGDPGSHSYNIFYSIYNCNNEEGYTIVKHRINNDLSLSKDDKKKVSYNEHDIIIDCNAHMYECEFDSSTGLDITYIGNIINQTSTDDTTVDMTPRVFDVTLSGSELSVENTESDYAYHTEYGFSTNVNVEFDNDNKLPDNVNAKLVVLHRCGLVQEFDLSNETGGIYINDKYALMVADNDGKKYNNSNDIIEKNIDYEKYFEDDCNIYVDVYNKNSIYRFVQKQAQEQ